MIVTALRRIIRVIDADRDDVLSDVELNDFQSRCFGARLQPADIEGVKKVLQKENASFVNARGITIEGFLYLNKLFITRNRAETSWLVLRQFGYSDDLEITLPLSPSISPARTIRACS